MDNIKEELINILLKKARGYEYEETKQYIKEVNGEKQKVIEKTIKHIEPDVDAINILLNNYDPEWNKEEKELRKTELFLKYNNRNGR